MDQAINNPMAARPFGFSSSHGGHETLVEQRPTDGHFSVAAKCFSQPPPSQNQQPVNPPQPPLTASLNGVPVSPTQQPKCGSSTAGLEHAGQQPPFSNHPGVSFQNVGGQAHAGQQLPSLYERLLLCSNLIYQLIEQQQALQALFSTSASPQRAMAAPPSSPLPSQPQQLFEVRTSIRPEQAPTSPTELCEALQDVPLRARNPIDSGQDEHQEGGMASQIQKGRKCNNSAEPKRQQCEVEPLEAQVWLEYCVGSGTSDVNGKQAESPAQPAAVRVQEGTGPTQLPGESSCDVIVGSSKQQKIVLTSEGPVQRPGSDGVDDSRCRITLNPELDRCKQMPSALLVDHPVHAPPVVVACTLFDKINGGYSTSCYLILLQHQHTPRKKSFSTMRRMLLNRGIMLVVLLSAHVLAQDTVVAAQDSPTLKKVPSTLTAGKSTDPVGKTPVVNWKLTCQQLCGEGFGGPACGLACLQLNAVDESKRIKLDRKSQDAVCPTLCENGLGSKKCKCKPTSPPSVSHDHGAICKAFCGATAKIQLSGCSPCGEEDALQGTDLVTEGRTTPVPNTTPNWDDLCLVWCKMGEGGTVCNCDLPPFI